jgi:hypothetical protein
MARDHTLYFGQATEAFTILGQFEIQPTHVRFAFDTFPSIESFDNGGSPLQRLRRSFDLTPEEVVASESVLSPIRQAALNIIGMAGRNWTPANLFINTVNKVLTITGISPAGGESLSASFAGDEYDALIANHLDLVGAVIQFAWTYGKQHDRYLAETAAVQ